MATYIGPVSGHETYSSPAAWRDLDVHAGTFTIETAQGEASVAPGEVPERLTELVESSGHRRWALLTACNPHGISLSASANEERHQALLRHLRLCGYALRPASHRCAGAVHAAVLALGIDAESAQAVARSFGHGWVLAGTLEAAWLLRCQAYDFAI